MGRSNFDFIELAVKELISGLITLTVRLLTIQTVLYFICVLTQMK